MEYALKNMIQVIKGSFALVMLTLDMLVGIRDPKGLKPLCIGMLDNSYVLCSESSALDIVGAEFIRDVRPGEIVMINRNGFQSIDYPEKTQTQIYAFEYIYFARDDSIIDGISVFHARDTAGAILYRECPAEGDIVVGVPESGISAAIGYARESGIPYTIGFVKTKYAVRTFISPSEYRDRVVRVKINPLKTNIAGKRVIIIDDSIVRGTTSRRFSGTSEKGWCKRSSFSFLLTDDSIPMLLWD